VALNPKYSNAGVNAEADALARLLDSGFLRIYDSTGTGQPANADTAVTTQVLLAELRFNATSAPAAAAGLLTFNAFTQDLSANATGTATWARALKSDGSTVVMDGSVGTAAADYIINSTAIAAGAEVDANSLTLQISKG
jgi:hypothetical protein